MHQKENTIELLKHAFSWQQPARGIALAPLPSWQERPCPETCFPRFPISYLRPCSRFPGDALLFALTLGLLRRIPAPGTARSRRHPGLWSRRLQCGAESHGHSLYLRQQTVTKTLPCGTGGWPQRWRRWLLQILAAVMDRASNWQPVSVE